MDTLTGLKNSTVSFLSGACERFWQQTQDLRKQDNLIMGSGFAGLSGIASAASWFLPCSTVSRFALAAISFGLAKFYGGSEGAAKVFFDYFPKAMQLSRSAMKSAPRQSDTGVWQGSGIDVTWSQFFDPRLAKELSSLLREQAIQSAWDFGCGTDSYSKVLMEKNHITASGLDGNPDTAKLSGGTAAVQDLAIPFEREKRDCVISLEVGDKISETHADRFLANIDKHASKTVVISWAIKGQKGPCHLNPQNNEYVIEKLEKMGWELDQRSTQRLRNASHPIYYWFQDSLMVFKKKDQQELKFS